MIGFLFILFNGVIAAINFLCYVYLGHHWYNAAVGGFSAGFALDALFDVIADAAERLY